MVEYPHSPARDYNYDSMPQNSEVVRCIKGQSLVHAWAEKVRKAPYPEWQKVFWEHRPYDSHLKKCGVCEAYELDRNKERLEKM